MSYSRLASVKPQYRYFRRFASFAILGVCIVQRLIVEQIVEPDSAQIIGCGEAAPIYADHHGICKFSTDKDAGYELVVAAIRKSMLPLSSSSTEASYIPFYLVSGLVPCSDAYVPTLLADVD